jgi:metal-responsive CopG/Arc/MetJ family transcriptional regulator
MNLRVITYNRIVCIKVSEKLWDLIEDLKQRTRKSKSEIIREAIKDYLEKHGYKVEEVSISPRYREVKLTDRDVILV